MPIGALVQHKRFAHIVGVAAGALGWIGLAIFGTILVMGERGPKLVVYGLAPTLLSLGLLAVGGRFWQRGRGRLSIYAITTFLSAAALIFLWIGAVVTIRALR